MKTSIVNADYGRTYGGKSAAERMAQQRQQFLAAGLELFGSIGFRATTVRLLCKQAGLIDRYFYRNFTTTEDLLEAVYTTSMDVVEAEVISAVAHVPANADVDETIRACLNAFFAAIEDRRLARVCWFEMQGVSHRIDTVYAGRIQRFADLLLEIASRLFAKNLVRDEETEIAAIAAIGAVSQTAQYWLLSNYKASRKTVVAASTKVIRGLAIILAEEVGRQEQKRARAGRAAPAKARTVRRLSR